MWGGCLDLALDRDGRLIGQIQARTSPKQTLSTGVFEIGVVLYREADRGRGFGREAVEMLTAWLFDRAGAERVSGWHRGRQRRHVRPLERLGYRLEGILGAYGFASDGTRTDEALYALTGSDWEARPTTADG